MRQAVVFQAAGMLLSYPDEELLARLDLVESAVEEVGQGHYFHPTLAHLRSAPLMELQAFHVQEFDLSRRHALHLTYWTDGDTRRRGEVLAAIKQTYRDSGLLVDLAGELPDFLPMVLEFAATGSPELGVALLNAYRASLELLRIGLAEDKLPQEGVVAAVCQQLGGPSPKTRAEVRDLLAGPPVETVGLDHTPLPYPIFQGS
ncbi:nitrate reductase molybdenum cofactor assembly chaperone [Tessaracoccus sp. OH4464_COT-324]|uniref:nitrate reductase molybdenum cofactor assembly chaperone n=1 Tax=Tessaracoccus sp. OH4464_COT-324 TaxID=2491059 RepID=UPI000F63921E|nr:nitrate reductase molybdenum cofactor assembly chaperone [Tessaracoccus sp. OH4464_COT-324]RRD46627.1 nitrate reductase molybdenum cofactor assembly chaperone [Tessaracoccus sp. OH4464_COT-324]